MDVERMNKLGWEAKLKLEEGIGLTYKGYR